MKKEIIIWRWKEKGITHLKNMDRQKIYDVMYGIKSGFDNDNKISSAFCEEILPESDSIFIDKDRNRDVNIPFVQYKINGEEKVLQISRYHKIIWSILDKYCEIE